MEDVAKITIFSTDSYMETSFRDIVKYGGFISIGGVAIKLSILKHMFS